jgi:glycine cleavage system regulatory protein
VHPLKRLIARRRTRLLESRLSFVEKNEKKDFMVDGKTDFMTRLFKRLQPVPSEKRATSALCQN